MTRLTAGAVVANRYRLERLIGKGGMGAVWSATHLLTHKKVALKFLVGAHAAKPEARRRFVLEARASSALRHPNVVAVHDLLDLDGDAPAMVLDLLEGETLGAQLSRRGALSTAETAAIGVQLVSAVGTAHAHGIVHRDLKPDNVFLVDDATGGTAVKVLDFGMAKLFAPEAETNPDVEATAEGTVLGTPHYMSPEQAFGDPVDHRADIWAIGVVLYECLSGSRPIGGATQAEVFRNLAAAAIRPLRSVAPQVPEDLSCMVGSMLARSPEARPRDLGPVFAVLTRYTATAAPSFEAPSGGAQGDVSDRPPPMDAEAPYDLDALESALLRAAIKPRPRGWNFARSVLAALAVAAVVALAAVMIFRPADRHVQVSAPPPASGSGAAHRVDAPATAPTSADPLPSVSSTRNTAPAAAASSNARERPPPPASRASARPAPTSKPAAHIPGIVETPPY
jgi:serine/threonine protein kinase